MLDRGVLDMVQDISTELGRCCPVGCQVPETPKLGDAGKLPKPWMAAE